MKTLEKKIVEYLKTHYSADLHEMTPTVNEENEFDELRVLYALERLEKSGFITIDSETFPKKTSYKLTKKGRSYTETE